MLLWDTFFAAGVDKLQTGDLAKATALLKSALAECDDIKADDPRLLQTRLALIETHQKAGELELSDSLLQAIQQQLQQGSSYPKDLITQGYQAQLIQLEQTHAPTQERVELAKTLVALWETDTPGSRAELFESYLLLAKLQQEAKDVVAAQHSLEKALEVSMELHGIQSIPTAQVLSRIAQLGLDSGRIEAAEAFAQRALNTWQEVVQRPDPRLAEPLALLAHILRRQKRTAESLALLKEAASIDSPERALHQLAFAQGLQEIGDHHEAQRQLDELNPLTLEPKGRSTFELLLLRALYATGKQDRLLAQAEHLIQLDGVLPDARIEALLTLSEHSSTLEHASTNIASQLDEIVELSKECQELDDHPELLTRIAALASHLDRRSISEQFYDKAIAARSENLDLGDPSSVVILYELGKIQARRRLLVDAATSWEKALESLRRHSGSIGDSATERNLRLQLIECLADTYLRQLRWERAEKAWRSLVRSSAISSREHQRGRLGLAQVQAEQEHYEKALEALATEGELEISEENFGRELSDCAFLLHVLSLGHTRQIDEACRRVEARISHRGSLEEASLRELAAAAFVGERTEDPRLVNQAIDEIARRTPTGAQEQLILARFYTILANHNERLIGSAQQWLLGLSPLQAFDRAVTWAIEANGHLDLRVANLLEDKARAAMMEREWDVAETATQQVLETRRILQGERSLTLFTSLQRLGELRLGKGLLIEACYCLEEALALADSHLPPQDSRVRELLRSLIEAHRRLGDFDRAHTFLSRLLELYDRFDSLRPEDRLDDLLRGIRLLLSDEASYRSTLSRFLDDALALAQSRGELGVPSLAYCLGQKARLLLFEQPDEAMGYLRRQNSLIKDREEATEFSGDQQVLARLFLYRGQPQSALDLLDQIDKIQPFEEARLDHQIATRLLETESYLLLGELTKVGLNLDFLEELLQLDHTLQEATEAEIFAIQLAAYVERPDLIGDEVAARAYANLDGFIEDIDWSAPRPLHETREYRRWELVRLRFELNRLSASVALERLKDHLEYLQEQPKPDSGPIADLLALLAWQEKGSGEEEQALDHLNQAIRLYDDAGDSESIARARLLVRQADLAEKQGHDEIALGAYREAVGDLKTHLGTLHRALIPVYLGLSRLNQKRQDSLAAESALLRALKIVEERPAAVSLLDQAQVLTELAQLQSHDGRLSEALELWKQVETLFLVHDELLPTRWLEPYLGALIASNHETEALEYFLDGLPLRWGQSDDAMLLAQYCHWLDRVRTSKDRPKAVQQSDLLWEVRELLSSGLGEPIRPELGRLWARALVSFAHMHLDGLYSRRDSTIQDLQLALELQSELAGPESIEVGEVLLLRAALAQREGDLVAAESTLARALNISESIDPTSWEVAEIHLHLAQVYFAKGKTSATEALLERTFELCRDLLEPTDPRWIEVFHIKGKLSLELDRRWDAFDAFEHALSLSKTHHLAPSPGLLQASGRAALLTDRPDLALELFMGAEQSFSTDPTTWSTETEDIVMTIGELLLHRDRFAEAEKQLTQVQSLQEQRFGFGDARLARVYRNLLLCAIGLDDLSTAEERLELVLAFQEDNLFTPLDLFIPVLKLIEAYQKANAHQQASLLLEDNLERSREAERLDKVAQLAQLLAQSRHALGEDDAAEKAWRETIEAWDKVLTQASPSTRPQDLEHLLLPLQALAHLFTEQQRYTEAEELTRRRLKMMETTDADDLDIAQVSFELAELYRLQQLFDKAEALHQRVLAMRASELGRHHLQVAQSERALGLVALGKDHLDASAAHLNRALENQRTKEAPDLTEIPITLLALGDTYRAKKDFNQAERCYKEAAELLESQYGLDDRLVAQAWTSLAELYEAMEHWSQAPKLLGRALESMEVVLGPNHLEVAAILVKTAKVYLLCGVWDSVSAPLAQAQKIRQDKLGDSHPSLAETLKLEGDLASAKGYTREAEGLYFRADQIVGAYYGPQSLERLPYRLALAAILTKQEEYDDADSHLQDLLGQLLASDQPPQDLTLADVQSELADLELARGHLKAAEGFAKLSLDARSRLLSPEDDRVVKSLMTLATIHLKDGRLATAGALAERALASLGNSGNAEKKVQTILNQANLLMLLALTEQAQGQTEQATKLTSEALSLRSDRLGPHHPDVAHALYQLGNIAADEKRLEKAESYITQALDRLASFYGDSHPKVFTATSRLAELLAQQGRLTLSEEYYLRNLSALEAHYGTEHPILADTLLGLGKLCRSVGNSAEAERYLKRAAELRTSVYGESDPRVASVLHALALVYQDERNYLAAEALLRKALQIREKTLEARAPELCESNLALARLYRNSGKSLDSEPLFKKVLEWRSLTFGDNHPEVAAALREMAEVFADQHQYLKAQALVRRALEIYGQAMGYRNLELVGPLRQLARLLEASGDVEEAQVQRQKAKELMGSS